MRYITMRRRDTEQIVRTGVYSGLACFIPGYSLVGGYTRGCYTGLMGI